MPHFVVGFCEEWTRVNTKNVDLDAISLADSCRMNESKQKFYQKNVNVYTCTYLQRPVKVRRQWASGTGQLPVRTALASPLLVTWPGHGMEGWWRQEHSWPISHSWRGYERQPRTLSRDCWSKSLLLPFRVGTAKEIGDCHRNGRNIMILHCMLKKQTQDSK